MLTSIGRSLSPSELPDSRDSNAHVSVDTNAQSRLVGKKSANSVVAMFSIRPFSGDNFFTEGD
jgi:hypothetical protein